MVGSWQNSWKLAFALQIAKKQLGPKVPHLRLPKLPAGTVVPPLDPGLVLTMVVAEAIDSLIESQRL